MKCEQMTKLVKDFLAVKAKGLEAARAKEFHDQMKEHVHKYCVHVLGSTQVSIDEVKGVHQFHGVRQP